VKSVLPVVTAGATFAFAALAGLGAGIWISQRTGNQLWVLGGLFAGLGIGAYTAIRLLMRSL
jgi:uncharacterized protein YneF (UPF0154 family)